MAVADDLLPKRAGIVLGIHYELRYGRAPERIRLIACAASLRSGVRRGSPTVTGAAPAPAPGMRHPDDLARPRVLIRPWVLLFLSEAPGHGYELVERLRSLGFQWGSRSGPIYRELRLMAEAGFVHSDLAAGPDPGPMRNVYELTPEGEAELARCVDEARRLSELIGDFIARHEGTGPVRHNQAR